MRCMHDACITWGQALASGPGTGESGAPALQVGTGGGPGSGPVTLVADEEAPGGGGDGAAAAEPDGAAGAADGAGTAAAESQPLLRGAAGAAAAAAGTAAAPASGAAPAAAKAAAAPGAGAEQAPARPTAATPAAAPEHSAAPAAPGLERCETRRRCGGSDCAPRPQACRGRHCPIFIPYASFARTYTLCCLPACLLAGPAPVRGGRGALGGRIRGYLLGGLHRAGGRKAAQSLSRTGTYATHRLRVTPLATAPSLGLTLSAAGAASWRGRVALVTGASAGIGWAVCTALAGAGLRVVAVARRRERLEALQQAVVAGGVPITEFLPVVCDITKARRPAPRVC